MALGQRTGRKRQVVAWRALAPALTSAVQPESFQQENQKLFRSLYKITLKGQGLGPPSNSAGNKDSATESLQLRSFSPHSGHSWLSP